MNKRERILSERLKRELGRRGKTGRVFVPPKIVRVIVPSCRVLVAIERYITRN